ncbi:MAG: response regulator transcription factor [Pseudomonadota bacterium]
MTEQILVVDDDPQITSFLQRYLETQGFNVICAATGQQMKDVLTKSRVDLCVLDVGLPDADGFDLMRELRETSRLPIIVLSVRNEAFDRVFGLEYGADDYVTKPFEPRELAARIRSVLRRTSYTDSDEVGEHSPGDLTVGTWLIKLAERIVVDAKSGAEAELTAMEFDLLRALAEHPRVVLSRDQLLDLARGGETVVGDRAVDVHVMRLRKKIEPDPAKPTYIKTVRGIGYCLTHDVSRS